MRATSDERRLGEIQNQIATLGSRGDFNLCERLDGLEKLEAILLRRVTLQHVAAKA
jgi:hypothetical protein